MAGEPVVTHVDRGIVELQFPLILDRLFPDRATVTPEEAYGSLGLIERVASFSATRRLSVRSRA